MENENQPKEITFYRPYTAKSNLPPDHENASIVKHTGTQASQNTVGQEKPVEHRYIGAGDVCYW